MKRRIARVERESPPAIAPFGEPVASLPLVDMPWRERARVEAERAGLELYDVAVGAALADGTVALVSDDTVFTAETLRALSSSSSSPARAAIAPGTALAARLAPFSRLTVSSSGALPIDLVVGRAGSLSSSLLDAGDLPLVTVCDEPSARIERVAPFGKGDMTLALPDVLKLGGTATHWLHLLELNLAFLHTLRRREALSDGRNAVARDARIHGTALVTGSIVAAGAEIEAQASVIDSYIGPGVKIAAHSVIAGSVIGARCHTLIDTHLRRVVAMSGSTLSNVGTSDALFGRDIFITTGVQFFAGAPNETVVVEGQDTGRACLSGAVGHKAILGARALFSAGVAVPSGAVIVMRPDEGATKLDEKGLARASMQLGRRDVDH